MTESDQAMLAQLQTQHRVQSDLLRQAESGATKRSYSPAEIEAIQSEERRLAAVVAAYEAQTDA